MMRTARNTWKVADPLDPELEIDSHVHVYPLEDAKPHDLNGPCPCGAILDGNVVIHNSFDGREILERAKAAVVSN